MKTNRHQAHLATQGRRSRRIALVFLLLTGVAAHDRSAGAQECITCRTEKCPDKEGVEEWCHDPPAVPVPSSPPEDVRGPGIVPSQYRVTILSEPSGVSVRLDRKDGRLLGNTPVRSVWVKEGRHRIYFELNGYKTMTIEISDRHHSFSAVLVPLEDHGPPGRIGADIHKPNVEAALDPAAGGPPREKDLRQPDFANLDKGFALGNTGTRRPIYKKWWFCTGLGVILAGGIVTAVLLTKPWIQPPPSADLRGDGL